MDDLSSVTEPYETLFENLMNVLPSILFASLLLLVFTYLGWKFSRWVTQGFKGGKSSILRVFLRRIIFSFVVLLGFILVLPIFGYTRIATFFLAGGSVMAVIFGIAFREIGQNILGGFLLAINRPFEIGDLVALGEFEGTVINLNLRSTHLRSYDGQDVFIPNTDFMQKPLVNYTRDGLRRFQFEVGLDYSNDAEKARSAIFEAIETVDEVLDDPSPDVIVNELGSSTVVIRVYYWINMFVLDPSLIEIRSKVINATKEKLIAEGFDLPSEIVEVTNTDPSEEFRLRIENNGPDGDEDTG